MEVGGEPEQIDPAADGGLLERRADPTGDAGQPSSLRDRRTVNVPAPPAQSGTDIHRSSDSVRHTDDQ